MTLPTTHETPAPAPAPTPAIPNRVEPPLLGGAFNLFAEAFAREEARIAKYRKQPSDDEITNDTDPDGDHL